MQVTKNITLDLLETGSPVIIKAKQNDRNTRYIAAHLYVDGLAYPVPSGTEIAFRYKKPDGTAGFYDALQDNSPAITVSGNTVTVELVEQVLTVSGCVHCEINMYNATSEKLTTFTFEISVEESVLTDAEIISSDYYNVLTAEITKALQAVTDATEQAENAAQSAQDAADSAAMSKDWAAGQPVTYNGTPVSIAYAGENRIASITAYGETPQGGTTEAPVALTGVDSVQVCGNNLLPNEGQTSTAAGITYTINPDKSITAKGTATSWSNIVLAADFFLSAGTYTLNSNTQAAGVNLVIGKDTSGTKNIAVSSTASKTFTLSDSIKHCVTYISVAPDSVVDTTIRPMLNLGSTAMPYEPYQGSVTPLPIPRALHEVGDVRDVCRTRVKSIYDKRIVLDGTESWFLRTENPNSFALGMGERVVIGVSNNYASLRLSELGTRTGIYLKYTMAIVITDLACSTVEELKAKLAENPVTVYYQSTAYDGTNGLDVCLTEYQTGFVELDGETLAFTTKNNIYWDLPRGSSPGIASGPHIINSHFPSNVFESNVAYSFIFSTKTKMEPYFDTVEALNAYLSAQKAAGTPVQVAYQLATPEVYATDPLDIDNAAGPLTVMTGGEVVVRMTELVGSRSPELTGKMDKAVYAQVGNPSELDNDNFLHCVNQRNVSGTISAAGYFIDRWKLISGTVQITENGLVLNGKISQILENAAGTDVTASASAGAASYDNSTKTFTLTATGQTITWAKLEKGSVATPYVPKGYGAELVECYRYFWISSMPVNIFKTTAGDYFRNTVYFPIAMRTVPSVTILSSNGTVSVNAVTIDAVKFAGNGGNDTVTSFSASADL